MAWNRRKAGLAAALAVALVCLAPSQQGAQEREAGEAAWFGRNFDETIANYEKVVRVDPNDGEAWFRLAMAHHNKDEFAEAIPGYKKAIQAKYSILTSHYNLACAYARVGDSQSALDWLEGAIVKGYVNTNAITNDPDLVSLHSMPRYQALIERSRQPTVYYTEGRRLENVRGLWSVAADGVERGRLTINARSKGFSRQFDLFLGESRHTFLLLSFSAHRNEWTVDGRDVQGTLYQGLVTGIGRGFVAVGSNGSGPSKEERRLTVALEGQEGTLTLEAQRSGAWAEVARFKLSEIELPNGGR